jgi:two-component system copper resistance phosphate regulon response regulator CusR
MFNVLVITGNVYSETFYTKFSKIPLWKATIVELSEISDLNSFEYFSQFHSVIFQVQYPFNSVQFESIEKIRNCFQGVLVLLDYYNYYKHRFFAESIKIDLYYALSNGFTELIYQVKLMLFSRFRIDDEKLGYKDIKINMATRKCFRGDNSIVLRNREFELIVFLVKNPGRIFSVTQLLEAVWDMNSIAKTNTVQSHISFLRKKIDFGFDEKLVHTVSCVGYKLE